MGRGRSRHRPRNDPSLYGGPYPFVQTADVKSADLHLTHYSQTYNDRGLAQSKLWDPGTLCITIAANIAETAILGIKACFPDSVVGFVADAEQADVRFIKYYIDTLKLRMQGVSRGTTQDNLSLDKLLTFDFLVPPVDTQQKVASILSAYDDLIANNQRRIEILEEMARVVYRQWFVRRDADPSRSRRTEYQGRRRSWRSSWKPASSGASSGSLPSRPSRPSPPSTAWLRSLIRSHDRRSTPPVTRESWLT